ncbi:MAG: hypothetical protein A3J48_00885 [Candidatus Doudnabacteria bacterium RIFCSPHIGHO2_02_FULL_46_11]|uniref:DNA-binding protein HU n=1 Tax=Candidatus Doudnabacteria bacterium RIFCSPHIGHO2_02_FULL_46_11 TaxID=1817832 RepID=A0A1F5P8F9_9BACT|nr:MAG: hypothetical protein A3J48_00885 [Candidatus Doudnabacteria bacterium RIFCSPHIGHO2_02_FULL_46_11]
MNKSEFIDTLAGHMGIARGEAEKMLNSFIDVVTDVLKRGDEVNITGFGAFTVVQRAARMGVNPQRPGEKIQIAASRAPKFKAGKGLKDAVRA